jgi:hypothetical protein
MNFKKERLKLEKDMDNYGNMRLECHPDSVWLLQ